MIYKYANTEETTLIISYDNGTKKVIQRITDEILEAEQITLSDIEEFQTPEELLAIEENKPIEREKNHTDAAMLCQDKYIDRNLFSLLMLAGLNPQPKAAICIAWLDNLWDDKRARVAANSEDFDYSNHDQVLPTWSDVRGEV